MQSEKLRSKWLILHALKGCCCVHRAVVPLHTAAVSCPLAPGWAVGLGSHGGVPSPSPPHSLPPAQPTAACAACRGEFLLLFSPRVQIKRNSARFLMGNP